MSCYPCCHRWVFVNDVEGIAGRSDCIVRERKKGHSCPVHTEREGKENGPQLPGVRQDWAWVYILSPKRQDTIYYTKK